MRLEDLLKVQPPPIRTAQSEPILTDEFLAGLPDDVAEALRMRRQFGLDKYGTVLRSHNGRDPMADAAQEALDLIVYLRQAVMERPDHNRQRLLEVMVNTADWLLGVAQDTLKENTDD